MTGTTGGAIHDGGSNGGVGQMGDDRSASTSHGIRRAFRLHDLRATGNGTRLLELLLADLALGKQTQELTNGGLGLLTRFLDAGGQLVESTGDAAGRKNADGDALQKVKTKNQ